MNPDGTIIDPAELAKLPTGNVVKRVVVKKPLEKSQKDIQAVLQSAEAKRLLNAAEEGEIIKASSLIPMPKTVTQVQRVAQVQKVVRWSLLVINTINISNNNFLY